MIGRTLFRYVFAETLRALALALSWLLLVGLLTIFLRTRFTDAGKLLGARECMAGLIVVVPYLLGFLLPLAVLAATISTFGRLSADGELVAMRASGLSPLATSAAPLAVGLVAALLILWLNMEGYRYAAAALADREANMEFSAERLTRPGTSFEIEAGEGKMVFSFPRLADGSRPVRVSRLGPGGFQLNAREFKCRIGVRPNRNRKLRRFVSISLYDGQVIQDPLAPYGEGRFRSWHFNDMEMSGAISRALIGAGSAMRASLPENLAEIRRLRARTRRRIREYEAALLAARARLVASGAGSGGAPTAAASVDSARARSKGISATGEQLADVRAEASRKLAFSLSPMLFALVGLGLGALARKSSKLIGLSLGVLVAALYYGTWVSAKALSFHGLLPPTLYPWIPNLLSLAAGALLVRHQNRA